MIRDSQETREWLDALSPSSQPTTGQERAHFLLEQLLEHARESSIDMPFSATTGYVNTIEPERRSAAPATWRSRSACAPTCAGTPWPWWSRPTACIPADGGDLGGHISSFASVANMFGAGFNHFWHAESENHGGDCSTSRAMSLPASMPAPIWKGA
jgi:pyruvate dehydrogenase E1 component